MLLIGIAGKKGSGKDEAVSILKNLLVTASLPIYKKSLADPLKEEAADYISKHTSLEIIELFTKYNANLADMKVVLDSKDEDLKYEYYVEAFNDPIKKLPFRKLLQWWGTEYRRKYFGDDYWIRKIKTVIQKIDSENEGTCIICVPDVRYEDEAKLIESLGGYLIRIERMDCDKTDTHISETALDDYPYFDFILHNDGDLEDYRQTIYDDLAPTLIDALSWL